MAAFRQDARGVIYLPQRRKWRAQLRHNGVTLTAHRDTEAQALNVRLKWTQRIKYGAPVELLKRELAEAPKQRKAKPAPVLVKPAPPEQPMPYRRGVARTSKGWTATMQRNNVTRKRLCSTYEAAVAQRVAWEREYAANGYTFKQETT